MSRTPTVIQAAAAAILNTRHLTDKEQQDLKHQRYYVHKHIAILACDEPALMNYLNNIYSADRTPPVNATFSAVDDGALFNQLSDCTNISDTVDELALRLQQAMESKRANPGVLFGFSLFFKDGSRGHGVIKADLEDDKRFFLETDPDHSTWSLSQVQDILPPPQTDYAKFAISPRPLLDGVVGIRDSQAERDSAADYFLQAVGLAIPRRSGTKRAVANLAVRSGYDGSFVEAALSEIDTDTDTDVVVERLFPDMPEPFREKLRGTTQRPMPVVLADDPYRRKYFTRRPRFELLVDESVNVDVQGRRVVIELPRNSDRVEKRYLD